MAMAKLIYGMMQSLDGYVGALDGTINLPEPAPALHRYFNERMWRVTGSIYGRRLYELMSYWDGDFTDAGEVDRDFAAAFKASPKWVVSRTLEKVGPNAVLLGGDLRHEVERLKAEYDGEIEVGGPGIAASLTELGLIDEYQLFLLPVVLGGGKPFFGGGAVPGALELIGTEQLPEGVVLVRYRGKAA
jgi:dihydrofolate reductase